MTTIATRPTEMETAPYAGRRSFGLSARLIVLTVIFMMLAELLIYLPAAAYVRHSWLSDRLMAAEMLVVALSTEPTVQLPREIEARLIEGIRGAKAIGVHGANTRWLLTTGGQQPPAAERVIDLRDPPIHGPIRGLLRTLFRPSPPATRILGAGRLGVPGAEQIELIVDEQPLRDVVFAFSRSFLIVSLIVSGITSALLYLALHLVVVRPVRRLSANIAEFADDPENAGRIIVVDGRSDEIGVAERALARMEQRLAGELRQKRRLAELGLAVSKINHELRNMLTTAQLLGDRLGETDDPAVKRIAPRLIGTLDRAIAYCAATLAYGRASEPPPVRRRVPLRPIVTDQLDLTKLGDGHPIDIVTDIAEDVMIDADAEQLGRVLLNLMRNSVEALARAKTPGARITIRGRRTDGQVRIAVGDNGPGVPDRTKKLLFSAFRASDRSGGTGLGLPVAEEIVRLHCGTLVLDEQELGACFVITIPDRSPGQAADVLRR